MAYLLPLELREALTVDNVEDMLDPLRELFIDKFIRVIYIAPPNPRDGTPLCNVTFRIIRSCEVYRTNDKRAHLDFEIDDGDKITIPIGEGAMGTSDERPPEATIVIQGKSVVLSYVELGRRVYIVFVPQ